MKSIMAAFLVGMVDVEPPEVAVAQVKVSEQKVEVTVGSLRLNGFGWVDKSAIVIDQEGYCWIRRAAEVYSDKTPTGIQITRTDKGYGLIVTGRPKWKLTDRASLAAADVVPCMSWEDAPLSLRRTDDAEPTIEPKFKTVPNKKGKGLE